MTSITTEPTTTTKEMSLPLKKRGRELRDTNRSNGGIFDELVCSVKRCASAERKERSVDDILNNWPRPPPSERPAIWAHREVPPPLPSLQGICVTHKEKSMDRVQLSCASLETTLYVSLVIISIRSDFQLWWGGPVKMIPKNRIWPNQTRHTHASASHKSFKKGKLERWSKQTPREKCTDDFIMQFYAKAIWKRGTDIKKKEGKK